MRARWAAAAVVLLAVGCGSGGRDEMEPDTVEFSWGERTATLDLTDCGRDGDVVILAAGDQGQVIQAAVDVGDGGKARTGATGDMGADDGIWGAFGGDLEEGPAGEITRAEVDGDRVIVEGQWVPLDENLAPENPAQSIDGRLVARCPEKVDSAE